MALPVDALQPGTLRVLMGSMVDYAGLFPPAGCSMSDACRRYARARRGRQEWMLGSFVVPAGRLRELEKVVAELGSERGEGRWPLSVLVSDPVEGALETIAGVLERRRRNGLAVASLEVAPMAPERIREVADQIPGDLQVFFEVRLDAGMAAAIEAVAEVGACAKVRTGGIVAEAVPALGDLARFLECCRRAGVPFKATAGLHHALRGERSLTYEADAVRAWQHGFLNLSLAAATCLRQRPGAVAVDELEELLGETSGSGLVAGRRQLTWGARSFPLELLEQTRRQFFLSFGSCSFDEPVGDLEELGLLGDAG